MNWRSLSQLTRRRSPAVSIPCPSPLQPSTARTRESPCVMPREKSLDQQPERAASERANIFLAPRIKKRSHSMHGKAARAFPSSHPRTWNANSLGAHIDRGDGPGSSHSWLANASALRLARGSVQLGTHPPWRCVAERSANTAPTAPLASCGHGGSAKQT